MSFLRPEITATLRLWREPLGWGAVALLGMVVIATGHAGLGPLIVGGMLTGIGLLMVTGAVRRTRLGAECPEVGVVTVDEGRIAYYGPIEGGVLGLSALARVEVSAGDWVLTGAEGQRLRIPRGALGADALPDALAPLPGLDLARAVEAFRTARPFPVTIWQAGQTLPALGRLPPRR